MMMVGLFADGSPTARSLFTVSSSAASNQEAEKPDALDSGVWLTTKLKTQSISLAISNGRQLISFALLFFITKRKAGC